MGEIRTERLVLREYREGDAARISEIANNKKIANNMVDTFPYPFLLEDVEKWAKIVSNSENCDKNFVVVFEGEIIGGVGFKLEEGFREGVVAGGFWFGEDYWGRGFATEVLNAIVDYIFENFDVRRISAGTFSWNSSAAKVLKKCGFSKEGCRENAVIRFGKVCDEYLYGLLKCEWEVLNDRID